MTDKVKIDMVAHWTKMMNNENLADDYDFDFDTEPGYENVTEKKKRLAAEQAEKDAA